MSEDKSTRTKAEGAGRLRLFFRDLDSGEGEHPADTLVAQRVGARRKLRRLANLSAYIVKELGRESKLWFDYEELKSEQSARREEAYFDLGVEHGLAASFGDELNESRSEVRKLAERLLRDALSSGLAPEEAASAAVLAAWSLLGRLRMLASGRR
mgnify:CR=1 FL=1